MTQTETLQKILSMQSVLYDSLWLSNVLTVIGLVMGCVILGSLAMVYTLKVRMYRMQIDTMTLMRELRDHRRRMEG